MESTARILIVEDENIIATDIKFMLEDLGYEVVAVASSGEEAVRKAGAMCPGIVLMDINLKGDIDGIEAATSIRDQFGIPFIYLTAHSDEGTLNRAKQSEPYGYLLKPVEERELHATIDMALNRHKIEEALRESEEKLRSVFALSPDAVSVADLNGTVTDCNQKSLKLFGYTSKDDIEGKSVFEFIAAKDRDRAIADIRKTLELGILENVEYTCLGKSGIEFDAELSASVIRNAAGDPTGFIGVVRDVSARKKAEGKLERSKEILRNLAAHLEHVREEERKQIAREIHDELGQVLTVLKIDVSWLSERLPADMPTLHDKTESMRMLIDKAIDTTKRITASLRPGLLDDLGLAAAVEWQTEEFQNKMGIKCHVSISLPEITLPGELSTALFRTLQEALTNVARHSQASRVEVALVGDDKHVELTVQDNGKGITREAVDSAKSYGLIGMRERTHFLGGSISIEGSPAQGTTVSVNIPIPEELVKR